MDLALNNLQRLICHKTHQTKPNQTHKGDRQTVFVCKCKLSQKLFINTCLMKAMDKEPIIFHFYFDEKKKNLHPKYSNISKNSLIHSDQGKSLYILKQQSFISTHLIENHRYGIYYISTFTSTQAKENLCLFVMLFSYTNSILLTFHNWNLKGKKIYNHSFCMWLLKGLASSKWLNRYSKTLDKKKKTTFGQFLHVLTNNSWKG